MDEEHLRQLIREELNKIFKDELREELTPLMITTINERVDAKMQNAKEQLEARLNHFKASLRTKSHRMSKILMEE